MLSKKCIIFGDDEFISASITDLQLLPENNQDAESTIHRISNVHGVVSPIDDD